jgi:hypothetical protein
MTTKFGQAPVCADTAPLPDNTNLNNAAQFPSIPLATADNPASMVAAINAMAQILRGFIGGIVNPTNTVVHVVQKIRTHQVNSDGTINQDNFVDTWRTLKYKETNGKTKQVLTNIDNTKTFQSQDGSNVTLLDQQTLTS